MGDDDQPGNIATVQLSPQDADALRARAGVSGAASEEAKQFGVDTDFRDIFASGGNDADGSGAESELDFDLGTDLGGVAQDQAPAGDDDDTQFLLEGSDEDDDDHTLVLGRGASGEVDEMQTKLDLAQAYMDMGDSEGARNLLGEVMAEGAAAQKDQAREMLTRLS
jgi:pilus assembly protein FimV